MGKLKLNLDELQVESFEMEDAGDRGTVHGDQYNSDVTCPDATCSQCQNWTCQFSCGELCPTNVQTCTCQGRYTCGTCLGQYTCGTCQGQYTCGTCPGQYTCGTCQGQYTCGTCPGRYTCGTCAGQNTCVLIYCTRLRCYPQ